MLISAAAAYAIVSSLASSGGGHPPPATNASGAGLRAALGAQAAPAWLGVDTTDVPGVNGAVVANVFPGSPAEAAGLQPGDAITQINNRSVQTTADLEAVLAGMNAGDRAEIQYERGPGTGTAQATLARRPANGP
jgi:S1-C subfamily serine protease